jgi:hypothetical protein
MIRLGLAAAAGGAAFALRRLAPKVREMQDTPPSTPPDVL